MSVDSSIIQRLQKLLALAEDKGATEAEAETAMRLAHELLAKHNLTLSDIAGAETIKVVEDKVDDRRPADWKHTVWNATARLYFCEYVYKNIRRSIRMDRRYIIGRPDNVETTKQMAQYFIRTVLKIAKNDFACQQLGRKYTKEFLQGCAARLAFRMMVLKDQSNQEQKEGGATEAGTSLVVLYDNLKKEVDDYLKGLEIETVERKPFKADELGFQSGWREAGSISLNLQVSGCAHGGESVPAIGGIASR